MSEYVQFYRGEGTTPIGNFDVNDVLHFDDTMLEKEHGFIQFAFPNPTLSKVQPDAASQPFTPEAAQEMLQDDVVMTRVRQMVEKMLQFWGMHMAGNAVSISDERRFNTKIRRANHNQLRMTRLLIFLKCMGWTGLLDSVKTLLVENVPKNTKAMRFWKDVV